MSPTHLLYATAVLALLAGAWGCGGNDYGSGPDDDTHGDDDAIGDDDDDAVDDDDAIGDDDDAIGDDDDAVGDDDDTTAALCTPIEVHADWELCAHPPGLCEAVFLDGAGCAAVCAEAGLVCLGSYENVDGACEPDLSRVALDCNEVGHASDYCVCGDPGGQDPYAGSTPTEVCDDLWMRNLAYCSNGFAEGTYGGLNGALVHVTNLNDSGAGSLREAAEAGGDAWIVFDLSGTISLNSPIQVESFKTIDGRGQDITLTGQGFEIDSEQQVIVHNLIFDDSDDDAIEVTEASHHVWIDHLSLSDCYDGLVDVVRQSTDVTISWCHFSDHDKTMLIGASPDQTDDDVIRVTLHHNHFDGTHQRHPRLRFGKVHAYNNYLDQWGSYGMGSSMTGQLLSQANIFEAGGDDDAIITIVGDDPDHGYVRSENDWALNGADIDENNSGAVFDWTDYYLSATVETANSTLRSAIEAGAGQQHVALPPH